MVLKPFELNQLTNELPGYTLIHSYRAGIPIYECSLSIRVMANQDISALEMAVLKCVGAGVDTPVGIDFILGAGRSAAVTALSSLLGLDLITPGSGRSITDGGVLLTDQGAEALTNLMVLRPEQTEFRVLFDGFTGELTVPGRVQLLTRQEVERGHLHVLPGKLPAPQVRDIDAGEVRELYQVIQRTTPGVVAEGAFHDLVEVVRTITLYRPCTVAVFDPPDEGQIAFRVLDRGARMPQYERLMAALSIRQPEVLPFSERFTVDDGFPSLLDEGLVTRAEEIEREAGEVRRALAIAEDAAPLAADEAVLTTEEASELSELRRRNEELTAQLNSLRHIDTHEHRPLLERAFRTARKRVIVVSPWMSPAAVDHNLLDLMGRALDRNVEIVIGWGMPPNEFDNKGTYADEKTSAVLRMLEALRSKKKDRKLRVVRLGNTHEKVLIKDEEFVVITSFNWFSFRGDPRRGFRQETGVFYSIPEKVRESASKLMDRIDAADPRPKAEEPKDSTTTEGAVGEKQGTDEADMKNALENLQQKFPPKHKKGRSEDKDGGNRKKK